MESYSQYLSGHVFMTVLVYFIGRAMARGIGKGSEARRAHGRYVLWWAVGAFAAGGAIAPFVAPDGPSHGARGLAMFCLLAGWMIGMIHGPLAVVEHQPSDPP